MIEGGITNTVQSPTNNTPVAKPKKFFKSRNSVPDANAIVAALSDSQMAAAVMGSPSNVASYYSSPNAIHQQQQLQYQQQQSVSYPEKTRRKKKGESMKKVKAEKPPKPEKPQKIEKPPKAEKPPKVEKPAKPPKPEKLPKATKKKSKASEKAVETPKPTRVLSRTRKVVNYSEDQSRSPPRNSQAQIRNDEPQINEQSSNDLVTSSVHGATEVTNNLYNSTEQIQSQPSQPYHDDQFHPGDSPSKHCGPPIVLRISKVSTNSSFPIQYIHISVS